MLFENTQAIVARQNAGRKWLEEHAIAMMAGEQPEDKCQRALLVMVLTPKTSDYLAEHDPQALKQAQEALNGKSYLDYMKTHAIP